MARAWAAVDPAEARRVAIEIERLANTIDNGRKRSFAQIDMVETWAAVDPAEAWRAIAEVERIASTIDDDHRSALLAEVLRRWVRHIPGITP